MRHGRGFKRFSALMNARNRSAVIWKKWRPMWKPFPWPASSSCPCTIAAWMTPISCRSARRAFGRGTGWSRRSPAHREEVYRRRAWTRRFLGRDLAPISPRQPNIRRRRLAGHGRRRAGVGAADRSCLFAALDRALAATSGPLPPDAAADPPAAGSGEEIAGPANGQVGFTVGRDDEHRRAGAARHRLDKRFRPLGLDAGSWLDQP